MNSTADPCAYVPLSQYSWDLKAILSTRRTHCHGIILAWNPTVICLFAAFHAAAIWTAIAITVQAAITFKRWMTVYFWAIIFTAWANILYTVTVALILLSSIGDSFVLQGCLLPLGDLGSGLGFLLVLWSRLHLIMDHPRALIAILVVILIEAIPFRIVTVLSAVGPPKHKDYPRWGLGVWNVMYRLEVLGPGLEICLACLYIYLFARRFHGGAEDKAFRKSFWLLVGGELFVIIGDAAVMSAWLSSIVLIRWAIGPFIYSLKLMVEVMILNSLTNMRDRGVELRHISMSIPDRASTHTDHGGDIETAPVNRTSPPARASPVIVDEKGDITEDIEKCPETDQVVVEGSSKNIGLVHTSEEAQLEKTTSLDVWERRYLGRSER